MAFLVLCLARAHVGAAEQTAAETAPDLAVYARIRDEGQTRSKVMDYATKLIDGVGARLTGSPNLKKAIDWARQRLAQMGLSRVCCQSAFNRSTVTSVGSSSSNVRFTRRA